MDAKLQEACFQQVFLAKALPLLTESLDGLARMLQAQGAAPTRFLGAARGAEWLKKAQSIQHLCDAGRLDRAVIVRALAEIAAPELSAAEVIDGFLLPHLLLAASRPVLAGDPPAWLLDALAAMIAVDADDALLDVASADERLDGEAGCLTQPWLARDTLLGRWLSRQMTAAKLWRLLATAGDWRAAISDDLLGELLAIRAGNAPRADLASHEEDDVFALMDAFHGLTAVRKRQRGTPTTQALVPAGGGLRWSLASGALCCLGEPLTLTQAAAHGFLEPPLAALIVPVALGAGLRAAGWQSLRLELDDADAADELLDSLLDLALDPLPPQTLDGLGFRIVPEAIP